MEVAEGEWRVTDLGRDTLASCEGVLQASLGEHMRCKSARGPHVEEPEMW